MGNEAEERLELNLCPVCGKQHDSIKMFTLTSLVFLILIAWQKKVLIVGCPQCCRRQLKSFLWKNLLPANVMWPIIIVPEVWWHYARANRKGHAQMWQDQVKASQQLKQEAEEIQAALVPLPPVNKHQVCRHRGGTLYRETGGTFGPRALALLLLWALVGLPLFCSLYALACYYTPVVQLKLIWGILFPLGAGFALRWLAEKSDCRFYWGLRLTALFLGVWSLYLSWVAWLFIFSGYQDTVFDPLRFPAIIQYLAENGVWVIRKRTVSNWEHYLVWALEAAWLIFSPILMVWKMRLCPRCERCGKLMETFFALPHLQFPQQPERLKQQLSTGELEGLAELPPADSSVYLEGTVLHCPDCRDDYLLTLTRCSQTWNDNTGKMITARKEFYPPFYCDAPEIARLGK